MPNTISLLPSSLPQINHDPTKTINGDPLSMLGDPFQLTSQLIFNNVNVLLGYIDAATGLNLLAFATALEGLLGGPLNLLTGFLGFLRPGGSTLGGGVFGPLLGLIPGLGGGTGTLGGLGSFLNPTTLLAGGGIFGPLLGLIPGLGSTGTLGGLGSFLNPVGFIGSAAGIFAPLLSGGTLLGGLIPGLDASKIITGTFGAGPLQPLIDVIALGFGGGTGLNFTSLQSLLGAIPGAGPVLDTFVTMFLGLGGSGFTIPDLTNALISIPARFVSGALVPGQMSNLGVGLVSSVLPELLVNGNFDAASSLIGQSVFNWDGTQGPSGVATSVYTVANGILKELFSVAIPVAPAQILNISGWTKWSSFTGPANSIALTVQEFANGILQSTSIIDSIAAPGTSGGWTQLLNSYTVPAGIDTIFVRPIVKATASAGTVWFGKLSTKPTATTVYNPLIPLLDASKIGSGQFAMSMITNLVTMFGGLGTSSSILSQLLGTIPNLAGGLTGLSGLTSVFTDLTGILGSPTALGSGTPVLPAIGSIPVLGGLLSGSTFLGSLVPGLDASKIITGAFPISMITNLATMFGGLGTGTSILSQLLGTIPNKTSGLTGLSGLTSVFTDLTGILGSPTALGSGTPVLPVIGSIPVLGGLLSGSTFLGSLIPALDASKITTGVISETVAGLNNVWSTITTALGGSGSTQTTANTNLTTLNGRVTLLEGKGVMTQYTSNGTWTKPTVGTDSVAFGPDELFTIICICGGNGGRVGTITIPSYSGPGGLSGGYVSQQVKYSDLPSSVTMTVGSAGGANNGSGGATTFGSLVTGVKGVGAVYKLDGSYAVSVPPGNGGRGVAAASGSTGSQANGPGEDGASGPFAAGGQVGSGATAGGAGGAAPSGIPSGGGGGGGGGVSSSAGVGGFPGGGGGGGGTGGSSVNASAAGAAGCIYVIAPH